MFKRFSFLALLVVLAMVFSAGVVLAQNQATVVQVGPANTSATVQVGSGDLINSYQNAAGSNNLDVSQTAGNNNTVLLDQTATLSANNAPATGSITQTGSSNIVVGAAGSPAVVVPGTPAIQTTVTGDNLLKVNQSGDANQVGLYQNALAGNIAKVNQSGDANQVGLYQNALAGNIADVDQTFGGNIAAAWQLSTDGSNSVTVIQNGSDIASVYQSGSGNNIATITQ